MKQTGWRSKTLLGISLALGMLWGISQFPGWVEIVYSEGVYPWIVLALTRLTGWFSVSLAEVLMGFALVWLVFSAVRRCSQFRTGEKGRLRVLKETVLDGLLLALGAVLLGYSLWGLNYARPALAERLNWPSPPREAKVLTPQLVQLSRQLVEFTNRAYEECCGLTPSPAPTASEVPLAAFDSPLNQGLERALQEFKLEAPLLGPSRAKPLIASLLMSYLGVAGFYFPWTGEANFNGDMPALEAVHSIAHEKGHQLGFAREDEANFIGFLACVRSGQPFARYSGYLFANRQVLNLLARADRDAWKEVAAGLRPEILRDEKALADFWRPYEGQSRRVARVVNDAHLRLNRVPSGILSYGESVRLLLQLAAERRHSLEY